MSERSEKGNVPRREWSRRDLLRTTALALTAAGSGALDLRAARTIHQLAQEEASRKGGYQPKSFTGSEWETLRRLCEMILPADDVSGSAVDAGVPEFIDLLCSTNEELARIFISGILWLDNRMRKGYGARFVEALPEQRRAMLDLLAATTEEPEDPGYETYEASVEYQGFQDYTTDEPSPLTPGVRFFGWVRRLTVDGFYTSPMGIADVDYRGNDSNVEYTVPEEAIRYALARSPFAQE